MQDLIENSPRIQQAAQLKARMDNRPDDKTGLPNLSTVGIDSHPSKNTDHVKDHHNATQPTQLNVQIYPQGRAKPVLQTKSGIARNDNAGVKSEEGFIEENALAKRSTRIEKNIVNMPSLTSSSGKMYRNSRSGNNGTTVQMKTTIEHHHGTTTYTSASGERSAFGTVGLAMDAHLDPDDPVVGSKPDPIKEDGDSKDLYAQVKKDHPKAYARGHLLNHDLGGYGVKENLYPITAGANGRHSMIVEQYVKRNLATAKEINDNPQGVDGKTKSESKDASDVKEKKVGIFYSVKVLGEPKHSQFSCVWKYEQIGTNKLDGNKFDDEEKTALIESKLGGPPERQSGSEKGRKIGLANWYHGDRKGSEDLNIRKRENKVSFKGDAKPGTIDPAARVTELTPEQKEEQRRWAASNIREPSKADKADNAAQFVLALLNETRARVMNNQKRQFKTRGNTPVDQLKVPEEMVRREQDELNKALRKAILAKKKEKNAQEKAVRLATADAMAKKVAAEAKAEAEKVAVEAEEDKIKATATQEFVAAMVAKSLAAAKAAKAAEAEKVATAATEAAALATTAAADNVAAELEATAAAAAANEEVTRCTDALNAAVGLANDAINEILAAEVEAKVDATAAASPVAASITSSLNRARASSHTATPAFNERNVPVPYTAVAVHNGKRKATTEIIAVVDNDEINDGNVLAPQTVAKEEKEDAESSHKTAYKEEDVAAVEEDEDGDDKTKEARTKI